MPIKNWEKIGDFDSNYAQPFAQKKNIHNLGFKKNRQF
jgi:hypothetical protein